jgi:hypothetical protein
MTKKKKTARKSTRRRNPPTHLFTAQLSGEQPPTLQQMANCVTGAIAFGSMQPWQVLSETELFAVDLPDLPRCYCSVMGAMGEVMRLTVYEGDTGFALFDRLARAQVTDSMEVFTSADLCYVDYVRVAELRRPDVELLHICGVELHRGLLWPMFRTIRRGCKDWYPTAREAAILAECLLAGVVAIGETAQKTDENL